MEWTREKTLLLINEYRQRRGLWDMTCDDYRKKDVKQRLLTEVSDVLGGNIPIQELEKKFHTLRTQYHREISRMKRKEPYNSKWFGFKNLNFLSSPYACRSTKGRLKSELQAENPSMQKYILGEVAGSAGSNNGNTMNDDYINTTRKSHASSRAKELEKLIEETTKDVDDDEQDVDDVDAKPKLPKELSGSYVQLNDDEGDPLDSHAHQQQQHHHPHHQPMLDMQNPANAVEAVSFQANESGELHYQTTPTSSGGNTGPVHVVPTRIIKIQRRDTSSQEDGYFDEHQTHHQLHPPPPPKRIYYEASGAHSTTTILSASTLTAAAQNGNSGNVLTTTAGSTTTGTLRLPRLGSVVNAALPPPKPSSSPVPPPSPALSSPRDEFSTYGEYVANEMRAINNREVLISLKHKINTAIFEANMAELQK
ncbi:uncharacterized protein LOC115621076 [Scaptodrosophila lebanonensis]|uniref:Uncharacterized protein LOC115621076 n=1 Tax=Drosophila lebanonensis TaxID=7225 RepID=A0A6J2T0P1_DROLE|nr:uncharacterized protein LOC115621076 [Scaptodrosophila lebanonensis]